MIAGLAMGCTLLAAVVGWLAFGMWGVAVVAVCAGAALFAIFVVGPRASPPPDENRHN